MPSRLTFDATSAVRNSLLVRNLKPYYKPGAFGYSVSNQPNQYEPSQYSVIDSPDQLIDLAPFADGLYLTNEFGPYGGYNKDISGLISVSQNPTNRGPYGPFPPYTDALKVFSESFQKKGQIKNEYSPRDGFIRYYDIGDIVKVQKNATYWDPPSFRPSSYSPFSVLLQEIPEGSNGPVTDDSRLAQLSVEFLKNAYQQRVDQNVRTETLGRVNILNGLQDPINLSLIVAGKRPLIFRDYKITSGGGNILSQGQDIVQRIAGFTLPLSPIPGDYFTVDNEQRTINSTQSLARASEGGTRGGVFGLFGSRPTSPSQLFLDYTGEGQRAQLTNNLDYNRYRPRYNTGGRGIVSAIGQAIFGSQAQDLGQGLYYVGSPDREPIYLNSPPGAVPINEFGQEVLAPVYGPQVLGKEYEGQELSEQLNFGFVGATYQSRGNITGGFSWVNSRVAPDAGKRVGPDGTALTEDPDYSVIANQFVASESSNTRYEFKPGSILDDTQRLVESMPLDGNRYSHVGNAINQTSKIFSDGYKLITKGSRVLSFTPGQLNTPLEYCRVFTKDTPYISYGDLQKSEGNIRKASYSILDKTYQLNIAPEKGGDSILRGEGGVKKYMFSIENLAWRTSSRPGLRYQDLPKCEQGPNGGRIMWFPPYDLEFSEDTRPQFNETTFLGRPEPIYTYRNTTRTGTLKWKILVDHPSVLDLVAQKVLANEGSREIADQVINSFFAGCKKYDLYELATFYNNVPLTELQAWQEVVNNPNATQEQLQDANDNNQSDPQSVSITTVEQPQIPNLQEYLNFGFYFDNNIPQTSDANYEPLYSAYTSVANKNKYRENTKPQNQVQPVQEFFSSVVQGNFEKMKELCQKMYDILSQNSDVKIKINLSSSASEPGTISFNQSLSERRNQSALTFFKNYKFSGGKSLSEYIDNSRLTFQLNAVGETTTVDPKRGDGQCGNSVNCGNVLTGNTKIYSTAAMACRQANIQSIQVISEPRNPTPANVGSNIVLTQDGRENQASARPTPVSVNQPTKDLYKGASKKLLRLLLNECDYFEVLKETDFFVYDSIKNKLKHFNPSFHSMTPEGLNSRLTFIQQCSRPGDTIPTIGPEGQPIYNDALNTSFGAPPVLVLRVGDFYNTKIIPTSFGITYEKTYDMNPEGIGFQPMIASITMSFNFIGGSGLAKPIETLQNALSFNYYANTEVYDERAETTDTSFNALDKQIIEKLQNRLPLIGVANNIYNLQNAGGDTIGLFVGTGENVSGVTGNLNYKTFVNTFVEATKFYYTTTISFFDNILKKYGYGLLSLMNTTNGNNRGYSQGVLGTIPTYLYGKPLLYQRNVDSVFGILQSYVESQALNIFSAATLNSAGVVTFSIGELSDPSVTETDKEIFKGNYQRFLDTYRSSFINEATEMVSTLVEFEQNYVFQIDKSNYIITEQADGKIDSKGIAVIYKFSGSTPQRTQLGLDIDSISTNNTSFLSSLGTGELYLDNFQTNLNQPLTNPYSSYIYIVATSSLSSSNALISAPQQAEFLILNKIYRDNTALQNFVADLVVGLSEYSKSVITQYYGTFLKNTYDGLTKAGVDLLENYKLTLGKNFVNYTPSFSLTEERVIDFQQDLTNNSSYTSDLQQLYSPNNPNTSPINFNLKKKFN